MKLSLNLIKQFVQLDKSDREIADRITLSLTEVENLEKQGKDTIIEIENKGLTHRPDCFSHLGIAREIAGYFDKPLKSPLKSYESHILKPSTNNRKPITITAEAKDLVPRYTSIVLTGIHVGPSPKWLSETLEHVGIRSISNVVDITNYVMIELGQPLHAYDYAIVEGNTITVRRAKKGEMLQTIDGTVHNLDNDMIIIADKNKPLLLGGVMGGINSEVTKITDTIILEAATFNAIVTRKTTKTVGLRTEGSTRYEKNLDPNLTYPALIRAVELLQEIAGAKVASEVIDIQNEKRVEQSISVSGDWINKFLGTKIPKEEMVLILKRLSILSKIQGNEMVVTIPTWRSDLTMQADIAEEIARIYGYDNIPITLPPQTDFKPKKNRSIKIRSELKILLSGLGFNEIASSPFVGQELLKKSNLFNHEHLQLKNPLTIDQEYMRRHLLPSLLEVVYKNQVRFETMRLFEINKLFVTQGKKQPLEPFYLTAVTVGDDYRNVKGFVEALFEKLGITSYTFKPYPKDCDIFDHLYHPGKTAQIYINKKPMGILGYVHPVVQSAFGIEGELISFDLNISEIVKNTPWAKMYQQIPQHPPVIEDLTVHIKQKSNIGDIIDLMYNASSLISKIDLTGRYNDKATFKILFQHPSKNLSDKEIGDIKKELLKVVK